MAYKRRKSAIVAKAQIRAARLKSVDPALSFGDELTLAKFTAVINSCQAVIDSYNTKLGELDAMVNEIKRQERKIADLSSRLLAGVGARFGKESDEYEKAGGTMTSEEEDGTKRDAAPNTPSDTPPAA